MQRLVVREVCGWAQRGYTRRFTASAISNARDFPIFQSSPEFPVPSIAATLEYPLLWKDSRNPFHMDFIVNLQHAVLASGHALTLVPAEWPCYGVRREVLKGNILFAFHSYDNPPNVWTIKESPIVGLYSIDRTGYSGWSDICRHPERYRADIEAIDRDEASQVIASYRKSLATGVTKIEQDADDAELPDRFVFFALQKRIDSVAELAWLDALDVLEAASAASRELQQPLVVKKHPLCDSLAVEVKLQKLCSENPWLRVSRAHVRDLLAGASAVITANSGVGLEALIAGRPVYCFGTSEWSAVTHRLAAPEDVIAAFDPVACDADRHVAYLLGRYWVGHDDVEEMERRVAQAFSEYDPQSASEIAGEAELNALLDRKILDYQKTYTLERDRLRDVQADYVHLKRDCVHLVDVAQRLLAELQRRDG